VWHLRDIFSDTEKRIIIVCIVAAIVSMVGLVMHFFQDEEISIPQEGGVFSEVYLGNIDTLNPIFAKKDSIEEDITTFLFSSLLKRDPNQNTYIPDAASIWAMNESADEFTFVIRDDVLWHDGVKLSVEDIVFTVSIFKDSFFETGYGDIFSNVELEQKGDNKIIFKLNRPDSLFINNMTFPILPKHLLGSLDIGEFIYSGFNLSPIGTGPFKFQSIQENKDRQIVHLVAFDDYYSTRSKIKKMMFQIFTDEEKYAKHTKDFSGVLNVKNAFNEDDVVNTHNTYSIKASEYEAIFMNNDSIALSNPLVRQALYLGLNMKDEQKDIAKTKKKLLFEDTSESGSFVSNLKEAKELLYKSGWQIYTREYNDNMRRNIKKEKLSLKLITIDSPKYIEMAKAIKESLLTLGINTVFAGFNPSELSSDFLMEKNYDLLLIGIKVEDGNDMFPFMHSSQIDSEGGLNLSNYENLEVDLLLEDYRMATEDDRREVVKNEIKKRIDIDTPMIFISQADINYYVVKNVLNVEFPSIINTHKDRFWNFNEWYLED